MNVPLEITRVIEKLPKEQGGYHFVRLRPDEVTQFSKKGKTRLIASFNGEFSFRCGLNPLGGGEFFIMLSNEKMEKIGLITGERAEIELVEDPDPLGVDVPDFLLDLMADNPVLEARFNALSDGGKRTLIFGVLRIKSREKRIEKTIDWLMNGINNRGN